MAENVSRIVDFTVKNDKKKYKIDLTFFGKKWRSFSNSALLNTRVNYQSFKNMRTRILQAIVINKICFW